MPLVVSFSNPDKNVKKWNPICIIVVMSVNRIFRELFVSKLYANATIARDKTCPNFFNPHTSHY